MESKDFINKFLTIGMNDFFYSENSVSFEKHIIECLVDVFGKTQLKDAYDNLDETAFYNIIIKYCASPTLYDQFIQNCIAFEEYQEQHNGQEKGNLYGSYIEISVMKMFLTKGIFVDITQEEIFHFENILLNNYNIIKWHLENDPNPNYTRENWISKKKILANNVELVEIKPEYLSDYTYSKYGIDINSVKEMDNRMVKELNEYIKKLELERNISEKQKKNILLPNTIISSGNGYIDALLIISIIVTELSIGAIYYFLNL